MISVGSFGMGAEIHPAKRGDICEQTKELGRVLCADGSCRRAVCALHLAFQLSAGARDKKI